MPDIKGRLTILEIHARNKKIADEVSLKDIARCTPGFTGADLANLLNEAAILTARRRKEAIGTLEVNDAVDRVVAGMEGTPMIDNKTKRLIAYHEIGHAIVGTLVGHHLPVRKVTLIPRGRALGLTWFTLDEDPMLESRAQLLASITGTLGGRAAEEVVFGKAEVTTGAQQDLQQLTEKARKMVTRLGMSDLGPVALEKFDGPKDPLFDRDTEYSEEVAAKIDRQVRALVISCYERACQILRDRRELMDRLVELLIDRETIDGDEFREIVAEYADLPEDQRAIATH